MYYKKIFNIKPEKQLPEQGHPLFHMITWTSHWLPSGVVAFFCLSGPPTSLKSKAKVPNISSSFLLFTQTLWFGFETMQGGTGHSTSFSQALAESSRAGKGEGNPSLHPQAKQKGKIFPPCEGKAEECLCLHKGMIKNPKINQQNWWRNKLCLAMDLQFDLCLHPPHPTTFAVLRALFQTFPTEVFCRLSFLRELNIHILNCFQNTLSRSLCWRLFSCVELKEGCYYYLQSLLYLDSNCAGDF